MELTAQAWVDLLAGDYPLSNECVIFTTKFRKSITHPQRYCTSVFCRF